LDKDVTLFDAKIENGRIILEPMRAVPQMDAWLYKNPKALNSVKNGLKDSAEGRKT